MYLVSSQWLLSLSYNSSASSQFLPLARKQQCQVHNLVKRVYLIFFVQLYLFLKSISQNTILTLYRKLLKVLQHTMPNLLGLVWYVLYSDN